MTAAPAANYPNYFQVSTHVPFARSLVFQTSIVEFFLPVRFFSRDFRSAGPDPMVDAAERSRRE